MKGFFKQSKLRLVSAVFAFLMFAGVANADIWIIRYCKSDPLGTYTASLIDTNTPNAPNVVFTIVEDC